MDDLHGAVAEVAAALVAGRSSRGRLDHEHVARPLRRLRGRGRAPVGVDRAPGRGRTGVIVSAIQGRDYARIYVKELDRGQLKSPLDRKKRQAAVESARAGLPTERAGEK